jgi:hypothetical protein
MSIPNLQHIVAKAAADHPTEWKNAHTGNAHTEDFIRLCAPLLALEDARFGLNGKRGNPHDISDDAVNVKGEGPGTDSTTGQPCTVIDIIGGAGGPNPQPQWGVMTDPVASSGAWVASGTAPPQPQPPPAQNFPYPDENTVGKAFQMRVKDAYDDAHRPFPDPNDQDAFRHFMRYGYSCHEMPEPAAANKHIAELRAQLGVPPE